MKHAACLASFLSATIFAAPVVAAGEDLKSREQLSPTVFRVGGDPRTYSRLNFAETASYLFCGQGELQVVSRALMHERAGAARYALDLRIDGAAPARELAYRVRAVEGADFDRQHRAGALRRTKLDLSRGCHTVELRLSRSTVEAVAVRMVWQLEEATRRRWDAGRVTAGGQDAVVEVGERRASYRLLEAGEALELAVDGPAWIRVLSRPLALEGETSYGLTIERKGRSYRDYLLATAPSRRARLADDPGYRLGRAREVVFAVGPGSQRLRVRAPASHRLLLRPEVASRDVNRLPGEVSLAPLRGDKPGWSARARLASYYDDNILRYSDKFVQRFEDGRDPARFRVESLDDTVVRADVHARRSFVGLGSKPAELGFDVEHRDYLRNSIKDWTRFATSWQQDLRYGRRIIASVNWAPNFYVRHIRDSDLTGRGQTADPFQPFEFERVEARLRFAHKLGASIDVRYHLGAASFRHSPAFREFDSTNLFGGVRLDHQINRPVRLSYGVELTDSDARGYDEDGETRATSDDTDPSYQQLDLMLAVRFRFPSQRRQALFLQAERGFRDYTTTKPEFAAPLHAGRDDDLLRLYASWQLDLTRRYGLTVFAQARDRSSTAPIDLDIGVEKDYSQWEAGVRITARVGG